MRLQNVSLTELLTYIINVQYANYDLGSYLEKSHTYAKINPIC